jgi:hypothetical protein
MRRSSLAVAATVGLAAVVVAMAACGSSSHATPDVSADAPGPIDTLDAGASGDATDEEATPPPPDASCNIRIDTQSIVPSPHVDAGTTVVYTSNPPSNGPHYTEWANFQEFATPVPDPYIVHALEHGAVALLYKCSGPPACPATVELLRRVRAAIPTDLACSPDIRVRVLIAPRPALDDAIGAAAWGVTYRAECADQATLTDFVLQHIGQGPENFCDPGVVSF